MEDEATFTYTVELDFSPKASAALDSAFADVVRARAEIVRREEKPTQENAPGRT